MSSIDAMPNFFSSLCIYIFQMCNLGLEIIVHAQQGRHGELHTARERHTANHHPPHATPQHPHAEEPTHTHPQSRSPPTIQLRRGVPCSCLLRFPYEMDTTGAPPPALRRPWEDRHHVRLIQ